MLTVSIMNDDGEEYEVSFPSKMEVCDECGGHGTVLIEGLRGHAFSQEEFEECFDDDEDRAAYFERGGKYDQVCPHCKGKNVVEVVDEEEVKKDPSLLEEFELWTEAEEMKAKWDREDRMTMRMERGGY